MSSDINHVVLVGRLTRSPELIHRQDGDPICELRLAVRSRARDEAGDWADKPSFFTVAAFGRLAETMAEQLETGWRVALTGRLVWREYEDRDGKRREAVSIAAREVQLITAPRAREHEVEGALSPAPARAGAGVATGAAEHHEPDLPF